VGDQDASPSERPALAGSSRWLGAAGIVLVAGGLVLLLVWGIGRLTFHDGAGTSRPPLGPVAEATTAPTTPAGLGGGQAAEARGRRPLRGFGEVVATVTRPDGSTCEVCLLAALTEEQRARGLMEVRDLGGYDGMVFVYDRAVSGAFYMRDTPTPLSIAFFGPKGHLVSSVDMTPCADVDGCPTYPAAAPFRFAVEVPRGGLPGIGITGEGTTIRLDGTPCPLAKALERNGR
jgi:uncharacterized membrane protein (UPF0127 family)